MKTCLIALLVALPALTGCSAADWSVEYENLTRVPLDYCVVVTTPPPPHRECTRTLQVDKVADVDPTDFNPVIWDPVSKLGTIVQMALGDDPPAVLVRLYQFQVEPGADGGDPALQPSLIDEWFLEPDPDKKKLVEIKAGPISEGMKIKLQQAP